MKKYTVIAIQGLLAPYRLSVFEHLSQNKNIDLEVWFMGKMVKNRTWGLNDLKKNSFRYKFLPGLTINFGKTDIYPIWINPFVFFSLLFRKKTDAVVMAGWDSMTSFLVHLGCKIFGIKFILWSGSTALEDSWRRKLTLPLVRAHVRAADGLIAYGTRARQYLLSLGVDPARIKIAYNANSIEHYINKTNKYRSGKNNFKRALGLSNKKIILYYGQLIKRKGVDLLIEAFSASTQLKKCQLLIIGSGKEKKQLMTLTKKLRSSQRVQFIENPGDDLICKYYAIADLFVLPSREENWGLVINEAMGAGLPIVASNAAGGSEDLIINDHNGYVFISENVVDLRKKMEKIMINGKLQKKFSKNSLKKIKKISTRNSATAIANLIKSTLEN